MGSVLSSSLHVVLSTNLVFLFLLKTEKLIPIYYVSAYSP
ncbi:hypothetical protein KM540_gp015 [Western grey kangaroopox virus]|uniref:Uncharacterized protein n=1 Tax=Western grey kangaroopox virus TaxID=1566307 RepID=A0A2C9DSG3_9POXV|nr:hypothetical protein KM540_gp015 [Western grey kangaroopox virus]ATI20946.1 hypothetical protein [Western grey kangaroopox virus]